VHKTRLLIGNYNYSSWSLRAWLYVAFHSLDIEIVRVPLGTAVAAARFSEHFSNKKVPVLIEKDFEIWDTIAILEYLAEKYPLTRGWPRDSDARAVARSVSAEMHSSFFHLRNELPMNCRRIFPGYNMTERGMADLTRITEIWNHCRTNYGNDGPWLFGDFSIADCMYASVVMRFRSIELELDPVSRVYCETMNECDAIKDWIAKGRDEPETLDIDELDWPSELID
jgi:glutathione S-transferase